LYVFFYIRRSEICACEHRGHWRHRPLSARAYAFVPHLLQNASFLISPHLQYLLPVEAPLAVMEAGAVP
jgi:hypothetical protein